MKAHSRDVIEIGDARYSRTQLENALKMLDNYQPLTPEFKAGDIIESITGSHGNSKFVVLEGATRDVLRKEYRIFHDADTLHFTDGVSSWSCQNPRHFRKVGSL